MQRTSGRRPRARRRRRFAPALPGSLERRVVPSATATALTTSANPAPFNSGATLTATVSGASGTPTGTVTFYDGAQSIGTAALNAAGQASLFEDQFLPGTHTVTASYGGGPNDDPSTSPPLSLAVPKIDPFVDLKRTAAADPAGYRFTFTATIGVIVFDASPPAPTGTVTLYDGSAVLGTVALTQNTATFTVTLPGPGSHQVTASYSGDAEYNPASSPAPQSGAASLPTTTTLTGPTNPPTYGSGTSFTATVTGGSGVPGGTVSFYDGTTLLGSAPLNGGTANFATTRILGGTRQVTAIYGGDANDDPSTSAPLAQVVNPAPTVAQVSTSPEAATYGLPVLLSATVDSFLISSPAAPTGTVTFYCGTTPIGTGVLNGPGGATLTTSTLPAGADQITVAYSGDANDAPSTSPPMTLTVSTAATTVALTVPKGPVGSGQAVVLTAFVTPVPAGTQSPTGPVVFYDGPTTVLGTATVSGNLATLKLAGLSPGSHTITAVYAGNGNFTRSTSAPAQVVASGSSSTPTATSNSTFLNQVYLNLLHRPIDSGALAVWSGQLSAGESRYLVVLGIESSREYALTTLSDLSRSLVGVAPSTSMQSQALTLLAKGQASPTALESVVLNSPEFFVSRAGRNNSKFVSAVSLAVTGLPPDPSKLPALLSLANRGNRAAVVTSILSSPAGLSAFVNNAFVRYLGHAAAPSAVQPYTAELARGVSSSVVIAQILSS